MAQVLEPQSSAPIDIQQPEGTAARTARQTGQLLVWAVVSTALLCGAGGLRTFQSSYYQEDTSAVAESPFPLKNLPRTVGQWHMLEGSEASLDPMTTRITGSTDHILASYYEEQTGLTLQMMLLYGPAEPVLPHIPEVCYPSSGFKSGGPPVDCEIPINDGKTARFRSTLFAKSSGRDIIRETSYYSFRYNGQWVPWVDTKNSPRKNPGIFKLQISRQMGPNERRFQEEPIQEFVEKMIPALEQMLAEATTHPVQSTRSEP